MSANRTNWPWRSRINQPCAEPVNVRSHHTAVIKNQTFSGIGEAAMCHEGSFAQMGSGPEIESHLGPLSPKQRTFGLQ